MHGLKQTPDIETERLLLRRWRDADREPFAAMCADPRVMEFFPSTQTREQSDAVIDRIVARFGTHGFGFMAVEDRATGEFLGFNGLNAIGFTAHFTPAVEIGWRLPHRHWGKGYASEAARAALDFGFRVLGLRQIVSFAFVGNMRSRRVMERIGMVRDADGDFDMPVLPAESPLRPHALYRTFPAPKLRTNEEAPR